MKTIFKRVMRRPRSEDAIPAQIEFWQSESHYYEERARAQGASATQMVTISIATLVLGAVPVAIDLVGTPLSPTAAPALTSWFLLAVPAVALLLLVTALRFITEMNRLVVYYIHADEQVERLFRASGWVGSYSSWRSVGGKNPERSAGNIAWFVIAIAVQVGATYLYVWMFLDREGASLFTGLTSKVVSAAVVVVVGIAIVVVVVECLRAGPRTERELSLQIADFD